MKVLLAAITLLLTTGCVDHIHYHIAGTMACGPFYFLFLAVLFVVWLIAKDEEDQRNRNQ